MVSDNSSVDVLRGSLDGADLVVLTSFETRQDDRQTTTAAKKRLKQKLNDKHWSQDWFVPGGS